MSKHEPRPDADQFRVRAGKEVDLKEWPTLVEPVYGSKKEYRKLLRAQVEELSALQRLHYASNRFAVLVIFQAMDAAGKDGAIRHVMSGVNPQGCQVFSFKHPSATELEHDFLWRTTRSLPERGRIGIFNRSYYEEVLIVRVHPEILRTQGLPGELLLDGNHVWRGRYESIVNIESHLHRNGTRIIKFFLHLSKEEQRKRFLARIDDPDKNWKFSTADVEERKFWKDYRKAYEECLSATSTKEAPWYVVPADDKENTRLIRPADGGSQMLRSLKELEGYAVSATDGDVGTVANFLFDDEHWTVRRLVVETGGFFHGRRVLVSPVSFREVAWANGHFHLALTKDKIKNSPSVDTEKAVSRQREQDMYQYYGYDFYWGFGETRAHPGTVSDSARNHRQSSAEDVHLRSAREVRGYHIQGSDDSIGHLADLIVDSETWIIRYLVVDTSNWWVTNKVLVAPHWASRISWLERKVYMDLSRDAIKKSPEWNPSAAINREYEARLYDYYGRPVYWRESAV